MNRPIRVASLASIFLLLVLVVLSFWSVTNTPETQALRYVMGWLWIATVPGCVLLRLMNGPQRDILCELTLGSAVGVVASTYVWLLLIGLGIQHCFLFWPFLPLLGTCLCPHSVFRLGPRQLGPDPTTLAGAAYVLVVAIGKFAETGFAKTPLPPSRSAWYPDDYWHLGLVHELGRAMPPVDPQVFSGTFWYHWLANAHIAAQSYAAGVDPAVAFTRLWQPCILVLTFALILVAARELTDHYWPGAIACTAMIFPGVQFTWFSVPGSGVNVHSPSQQWVFVPILLCITAVIRVLRTHERLVPLAIFAFGGLGCLGGKASALPVLICGLGLAALASLWIDRSRTLWLCALTGLGVVLFGVSMAFTSQANAGTRIQLFSTMRMVVPWIQHAGKHSVSLDGAVPGIQLPGGLKLLCLLLVCMFVMRGSWLLATPLLRNRVSAWFLLGSPIAGFCAMMLVNQDGMSQVYFFSGALPALGLVSAAGVQASWQRAARCGFSLASLIGITAVSAAIGWLVTFWTRSLSSQHREGTESYIMIAISLCVVLLAAIALVVVISMLFWGAGWLALSSFCIASTLPLSSLATLNPGSPLHTMFPSAVLVTGVTAILIGRRYEQLIKKIAVAGMTLSLVGTGGLAFAASMQVTERVLAESTKTYPVEADEARAAAWVREHTEEKALLATNVHCNLPPEKDGCAAKGFWVAALTGRRVMLGAWAYTPEAHAAHGVGQVPSMYQPFHDDSLYRLNQSIFSNPTQQALQQLRERGVDYLYGSARYTPISDKLGTLAKEVHRSGNVVVYSLN